ncbi:acyl-CoA dehydrogenase [soil metagenome]
MKLNDEQREFQSLARLVSEKQLAPLAPLADVEDGFDRDAWEVLRGHGFVGLGIDERHQGLGHGVVTGCLVIEQLARTHASAALCFMVPYIYAAALADSSDLAARYLPRIASGEALGCFLLTEPGAGSDAASIITRAERDGARYVVNGTKHFITNGDVADLGLLYARTGGAGSAGMSAFLLEMDTPGVVIGRHEKKMGLRGCSLVEVRFENAQVPASNLIGDEGKGLRVALTGLDSARVLVSSLAVGLAQGALDKAVEYAKGREQFGRPITSNQGLQWLIADQQMAIAASRELALEAARKVEEHESDALQYASMAKAYATDTCMQVTTNAVQIFGGYGYLQDYGVERMMRDAKILQIFEGTNQIQRIAVARSIIGRE